jgi:hypothetical protein
LGDAAYYCYDNHIQRCLSDLDFRECMRLTICSVVNQSKAGCTAEKKELVTTLAHYVYKTIGLHFESG